MNLQYNDLYNFLGIVGDIVSHPVFLKLRFEKHHGSNRYDHSLRVAIKTYKFAIKHKLDVVEVTRASLLHDFFFNKDFGSNEQLFKLRTHPMMSVVNSKMYFNINEVQEDIIRTHMFPITKTIPKSYAGMIVSLIDKEISIYETFKYRLRIKNNNKSINIDLNKDEFKEKEILQLSKDYNYIKNTIKVTQ